MLLPSFFHKNICRFFFCHYRIPLSANEPWFEAGCLLRLLNGLSEKTEQEKQVRPVTETLWAHPHRAPHPVQGILLSSWVIHNESHLILLPGTRKGMYNLQYLRGAGSRTFLQEQNPFMFKSLV